MIWCDDNAFRNTGPMLVDSPSKEPLIWGYHVFYIIRMNKHLNNGVAGGLSLKWRLCYELAKPLSSSVE